MTILVNSETVLPTIGSAFALALDDALSDDTVVNEPQSKWSFIK